jgi:selenocysteine lyase/cysteine desulfurase
VLLGGAEPVFCEMDLESCSLSVDACEKLLCQTKAEMVIQIHFFGIYSDRLPIYKLCERFGAFYFEDAAGWFPPVPDYQALPSSCLGLSFGHAKVFALGGGGLLCCAEASLARDLEQCLKGLPEYRDEASKYEAVMRKLAGANGLPNGVRSDCSRLAFEFKELWIGKTGFIANAPNETEVNAEKARRRELTEALTAELSKCDVNFFAENSLTFPSRFSFLSKDNLLRDALSFNGIFVSRLFQGLDMFFPSYGRSECLENSRRMGDEILNVSLHDEANLERIRRAFIFYRFSPWKRRFLGLRRTMGRRVHSAVKKAVRVVNHDVSKN